MSLKEQGFGAHSAKTLGRILRGNNQIISIDLSLNNLNAGLDSLISGIRDNNKLVSLKMRNNCIDGRKFQQ